MLHIELQEEEEFQESDVLWPDAAQVLELPQVYYSHVDTDDDDDDDDDDDGGGGTEYSMQHRLPMELQILQKASSPIDIPGRKVSGATGEQGTSRSTAGFSKFGASHHAAAGFGGGSVIIGSHVFVPPHIIVDRRAKRDKAMVMFVVPSGKARARKMREQD